MTNVSSAVALQSFRLALLKVIRYSFSIAIFYLSALYFNFSKERDYWVLSSSFILILSQLFFGPIQDVYRIQFVADQRKRGIHKSLRTVCALNTSILIICAVLVLLGILFKYSIASWIAPGFDILERRDLAHMIAIVMPALAFQQMMVLLAAALNSTDHFEYPETAQILSSAIALLIIVIWQKQVGIYSLIAGSYAGYLLAIFMMLRRLKIKFRSEFPLSAIPDRTVFSYFSKALPFWIPFFAGQLLSYTERALTSYLPQGNVSLFDYGRKLVELPMGVIIGITHSLYSVKMSSIYSLSGLKITAEFMQNFIRFMIFAFTPITAVFLFCGNAIYDLLFSVVDSRYSFQRQFSSMMMAFSLSIPSLCIYAASSQTLIAFGRQRLSALTSCFFTLSVIILDLSLFHSYGIICLILNWSLLLLVSSVLQVTAVIISSNSYNLRFIKEITVLPLILIAVLWFTVQIFPYEPNNFSKLNIYPTFYIASFFMGSILLLIVLSWLFRIPEFEKFIMFCRHFYEKHI